MIALTETQIRQDYQVETTSTPLTIKGEEYQFIVSRNPNDYEPARERISSEINKRFDGWSNDHDRQFDESAIFFLLKDGNGELRAAIRMVMSNSGETAVPVSRTDRECEINFDDALEYSGLWFDEFRHCLALAGMMGHWVDLAFGDRDVYGIFEASNRVIRRIYLRSFGMDEVDHPLIAYDGFSYSDSGETVEWQLAVCRRESRFDRAASLLNSAGAISEASMCYAE